MRITRLRAANFRNIEFSDLDFGESRRIFFVGKNGQGKTNLLETIGLLAALRSFRTRDTRLLIRHEKKNAQVFLALSHELEGATELTISLFSNGTKSVLSDAGTPVRKLSEFVGRFPVVVLSSDGLQLVRGSPSMRRRWLDLTLSTVSAEYFRALQNYHRALDARNRLLKNAATEDAQLEAFEKILAENGTKIVEFRSREIAEISKLLSAFSEKIAQKNENASLAYETFSLDADAAAWREIFRRSRPQDKLLRATQRGPHRDDFCFKIFDRPAEGFASEGQQRGLVLSLELARFELYRERLGIEPVVLADDVIGELDPSRKAGFWAAVGAGTQIFATGTSLPENASEWKIFRVDGGQYFSDFEKNNNAVQNSNTL